jgi:hypothetical protein
VKYSTFTLALVACHLTNICAHADDRKHHLRAKDRALYGSYSGTGDAVPSAPLFRSDEPSSTTLAFFRGRAGFGIPKSGFA